MPDLDIDENLVERVRQEGVAAAAAAEGCESGLEACVKGTVKATGPTIQSMEHPEVVGVIRQSTSQEHLMSQVMGFW